MLLPYPDTSKNEFDPDFFLGETTGRFRHSMLDHNEELNMHIHRSFNLEPNYYRDEERPEDPQGFARDSGSSFRRQGHNRRPQEKLPFGAKRRKGAGRKTVNPKMEVDLVDWVEDYLRHYSQLTRNLSQAQGHHRAGQAVSELELQGVQGLVRQVPQAQ